MGVDIGLLFGGFQDKVLKTGSSVKENFMYNCGEISGGGTKGAEVTLKEGGNSHKAPKKHGWGFSKLGWIMHKRFKNDETEA